MIEETVYRLKNMITTQRFVNCCSRKLSVENKEGLECLLTNLKEGYKNIYVEIDVREFEKCENEKEEVNVLLESIDRELNRQGLDRFQGEVYSMATALSRWGDTLHKQALLVFHCFHDRYSENEKDILRSLRKTISNKDRISSYLRILIISNRKVSTWELFPESNLDDRHLAFFEIESIEAD